MNAVSTLRSKESWQIADKLVSLLEAMEDPRRDVPAGFGGRLRTLSKARGLASDEDAARLIGVSYRQYQRWLSGESEPRGASLKMIADAYDVPLSDLIGVPDRNQLDRIEDEISRQGELLEALAEIVGSRLATGASAAALRERLQAARKPREQGHPGQD